MITLEQHLVTTRPPQEPNAKRPAINARHGNHHIDLVGNDDIEIAVAET